MLSLVRWFSREGEYAGISAGRAVHPDLAETARNAIRNWNYEDRGTRDDGALLLVTRTQPPLLVVAKPRSVAGAKPELFIMYITRLGGDFTFRDQAPPQRDARAARG